MKKKSLFQRRLRLFFLSILLVILGVIFLLFQISARISPFLVTYAKNDASTILIEVMNQIVQKQVASEVNFESLFITSRDSSDMITMIDFNPSTMNQILSRTNELLQKSIQAIEDGNTLFLEENGVILDEVYFKKIKDGRITQVPIGVITKNAILSNLGPKIPVRIHFVGTGSSHLSSKMSNYGINNTLLETFIEVTIKADLLLPLSIESVEITSTIPLSITMIQGKVPHFYQGGYQKDSALFDLYN